MSAALALQDHILGAGVLEGNVEAMSRLTPNSSRASTPQPRPNQSSTLQALVASVPGVSSRKKIPCSSPSPAPVAPRKPATLQTLLTSIPKDPAPQGPSSSSPVSSGFGHFDSTLPPPQHLALPGQPEHLYPGQPQYLAQPLPPRLHQPQSNQQHQTPQESSYYQRPYRSRPPPQFRQQQTPQQDSFAPSQYQAQPLPQYAPGPKSDRELEVLQSEYGIQMARQEAGNNKPAVAAKPATNGNKAAKPAAARSKPKVIAPAHNKPAASEAALKAAPKVAADSAPKSVPETKITGKQHKKVARFDWLLRSFLNSLNAIYDEFGGIPDQIKIIDDGVGRHHAQAVIEGYTGEVDDEDGIVEGNPQIDVNKLLIDNSWDESKRLRGPNIPEPMPASVKLMTSEYSNQGLRPQPPQYTMDADGKVQLAETVHQKPEHILHILGHLQNSPLGFTSKLSAPVTPNISVEDGNVTLDAAQWDIVKDCLTVVHYMNDYSKIGKVDMYQEARASWIRMFGWAPGIDEMIQAKQRAHDFREETGLHTNALGTRIWIADEKGARERRDCAVHRPEEEVPAPEAPSVHAKKNTTSQSGQINKPANSALDNADIVILRAAIDASGKAFVPASKAKAPILPSMAAHTLIYYPPRRAAADSSLSSRTAQVIELSDDEDEGVPGPMRTTHTYGPAATPTASQKSSKGKQVAVAQGEEHGHHTSLDTTTSELMGPLIPARDPVIYPGSNSQEMSRKRKASSCSPSSAAGTSKRQAMRFNAHPEADAGAERSTGLDTTGVGMFPGVAADVGESMRWEEERNRLKKEKNGARLKSFEGRMFEQNDLAMDSSGAQ